MKPSPSVPAAIAKAHFPFSPGFLPLAIEFVEKAAGGFDFGRKETGGLVLATEELFAFYQDQAAASTDIELTLENRGYRLILTLSLRLADPDLRAFNLTYRVNPESEESLAGMGPMIASRSVTRLRLDFGADDRLALHLVRDRDYPPASSVALAAVPPQGETHLLDPTGADIQHFAALVSASGARFVPDFLARPGMAADMLAAGDLSALLAEAGGIPAGGVLWRRLSEPVIELFGPYLFAPEGDDALLARLLDEAVGRIGRSGARILFRRQDRLPGHERFFDFLGELTLAAAEGETTAWTHYFRQLREESGSAVYADPRFAEFLRAEYERLCLPRQVRDLPAAGARRPAASALTVEFEHGRSLATLRPLCAGTDMPENLAAHLELIEAEGIRNVIVEIDTGRADDAAFAPSLNELGFLPRLLVPDAGRGDLVLFAR